MIGTGCVQPSPAPQEPFVYGEARNDYNNGQSGDTTTSLKVFDVTPPNGLNTTTGYDDVTGIGTPNGPAFLSFGEPSGGQMPEAPVSALLVIAGIGSVVTIGMRRRRLQRAARS